jgi:hypothetical protein
MKRDDMIIEYEHFRGLAESLQRTAPPSQTTCFVMLLLVLIERLNHIEEQLSGSN